MVQLLLEAAHLRAAETFKSQNISENSECAITFVLMYKAWLKVCTHIECPCSHRMTSVPVAKGQWCCECVAESGMIVTEVV